jgi:chromosome segregation ATPase
LQHYSDDGTYCVNNRGQDLVSFVGLLPESSQRAPVSRPAETESTTAVAGGVGDDPGRIIYDLEEKLKTANATISNQTAEIARLQAEWRSEFNAAQQLRSQVEQLELLLDDARENLRSLEADGTAMDHHCEGMKAAFLAVIKTLTGGRA